MGLWEFDCSSWQLELTESLLAVWRLYSKQGRQSGLGIEGGFFPLDHQNPDSGVNRRAQEVFWIQGAYHQNKKHVFRAFCAHPSVLKYIPVGPATHIGKNESSYANTLS